MIDIEKLLNDYNVKFVTGGHNVAKGNINVKCPFCGSADKSEHLGINLSNGFWGCWRSEAHRGSNLAYLLQHLLSVTYREAERLSGKDAISYDPASLDAVAGGMLQDTDTKGTDVSNNRSILLPQEFRPLHDAKMASERFLYYLSGRGFPIKYLENMSRHYKIKYAISGDYANRIILPVSMYGVTVSFTARSIKPNNNLRYLSASNEDSFLSIKSTIYNFDAALSGGDTLFVVEGPFDALKVDWFARDYKCHAVALFNMSMESAQYAMMLDLIPLYKRVVFMLDSGEDSKSNEMAEEFVFFKKVEVMGGNVPFGKPDPGELSAAEVKTMCKDGGVYE